MHRRQFLGVALAAALPAQQASPWGEPVIDIHHHPRATPADDLKHLDSVGIPRANLLAGSRSVDRAKVLVGQHPKRFIYFGGADVAQPEAFAALRKIAADGAHGFGEISRWTAPRCATSTPWPAS